MDKFTGLLVRTDGDKYCVDLWIAGKKSEYWSRFDTEKEMLSEIERLTSGLRLPPCSCYFEKNVR